MTKTLAIIEILCMLCNILIIVWYIYCLYKFISKQVKKLFCEHEFFILETLTSQTDCSIKHYSACNKCHRQTFITINHIKKENE